jgi:NADH-quinone oxidoreductase subunit N
MGTFANLAPIWAPEIAILSFLTMTIGNLIAIPQKNIKRLMAFSAISQAGYILFGFLSTPELGVSSIIFYLLVYTFMNIAAFATISAFEHATGFENIEDYAGLARQEPILALALLFSLLSLAGVPPFAGFFGKYYLFYALMKKGYMWLVIAGAVNSTIALYYYLLVLKQVYIFDRKKEYPKIVLPISVKIALIITIAVIVLLGIFPTPVVNITAEIARQLFPVTGMLPN